MTTNTGAPMTAVTTPKGSSDGAMTVRAMVSRKTRNAAPKITEIGRILRYDVPTRRRTMCGTMMPTKRIEPHRRNDRGGAERRGSDHDQSHLAYPYAQRTALVLAHAHRVERPTREHADEGADGDVRDHEQHRLPVRTRQRTQQPQVAWVIELADDCCWRNVCALVSSADTATPARIGVAAFERNPLPPISHVHATAIIAPPKANNGVQVGVDTPDPTSTMAIVAPRPAPAATPSRYGSARGLQRHPGRSRPPRRASHPRADRAPFAAPVTAR